MRPHNIKRAMIPPAPIDRVAPALAADVGGEAHAAVRILVRGRGMNHVGAVNLSDAAGPAHQLPNLC